MGAPSTNPTIQACRCKSALCPFTKRNQQYEIGLKADVAGMNLGAALFSLKRPFAYVDAGKNHGDQVNNGLELTAPGNVTLSDAQIADILRPKK